MKEVLVLGGSGFIGRNIVQFLVDRGDCNVTAADIKTGSNFEAILNDKKKSKRFKVVIDDFSRIEVKPSIGNLLLWKSIYETEDKFYIDAIRVGWEIKIFNGESINKINIQSSFPWLELKSQQAKDIERFKWFSNGFIAINPNNKDQILDIRYSSIPNQVGGLWGIELSKEKANNEHVKYITNRNISKDRISAIKKMLFN